MSPIKLPKEEHLNAAGVIVAFGAILVALWTLVKATPITH